MTTETAGGGPLLERLEALRQELTRLGERVAALEANLARAPGPGPGSPAPDGPPPEGVSEEIVAVISAAIAAFLGKRPHIRQVRLLGSAAWAQQGRVTIQASHALGPQHR
jgi:methylmalonyl-CoA carboxyltransferase large subunit